MERRHAVALRAAFRSLFPFSRAGGAAVPLAPGRRSLGGWGRRFLLFDRYGALADAFAEVGQLRAAHGALPFDFDLVDAGRMKRENALDAFAVADAPHGKGFVQAPAAFADDHPGEDLDALLFALHDL